MCVSDRNDFLVFFLLHERHKHTHTLTFSHTNTQNIHKRLTFLSLNPCLTHTHTNSKTSKHEQLIPTFAPPEKRRASMLRHPCLVFPSAYFLALLAQRTWRSYIEFSASWWQTFFLPVFIDPSAYSHVMHSSSLRRVHNLLRLVPPGSC